MAVVNLARWVGGKSSVLWLIVNSQGPSRSIDGSLLVSTTSSPMSISQKMSLTYKYIFTNAQLQMHLPS